MKLENKSIFLFQFFPPISLWDLSLSLDALDVNSQAEHRGHGERWRANEHATICLAIQFQVIFVHEASTNEP